MIFAFGGTVLLTTSFHVVQRTCRTRLAGGIAPWFVLWGYLLVFLATLWKRKEPHIYVANWFFLAFIVTIAMLHVVNNLAVPVSLFSSKSYVLHAGVQDAMTQWWYGHNAVGFFLTAGFLGIMYYFIPKQANRPVYSYRLSIVHFWSLIFPVHLGRAPPPALHGAAAWIARPRRLPVGVEERPVRGPRRGRTPHPLRRRGSAAERRR